MELSKIILPDERFKTENMHEAYDEDDYEALKKCFKNKYTTFKYEPKSKVEPTRMEKTQ